MATIHRDDAKQVSYDYPLPTTGGGYDAGISFNVSFFTNNAVSPVRVKDGVAGKSIYITDIVLSGAGASRVDLRDSDNTSVLIAFMGASNPVVIHLKTHKKVTAAKDLNVTTPTAVGLAVSLDGYIR